MSEHTKEMWVEWTFTGFWMVLFFVGWAVASRTARNANQTYRMFVPLAGLVTVFIIVGSIVLGGVFYP